MEASRSDNDTINTDQFQSDNNDVMTTPVATRAIVGGSGPTSSTSDDDADDTTTTCITPSPGERRHAATLVTSTPTATLEAAVPSTLTSLPAALPHPPPPPPAAPILTPNSMLLLREWTNHQNQQQQPPHDSNEELVTSSSTPVATREIVGNHTGSGDNSGNSDVSSPVPPVAPAVVLSERVDSMATPLTTTTTTDTDTDTSTPTTMASQQEFSSSSSLPRHSQSSLPQYTYPVATFVSNFVREHIYASAIDVTTNGAAAAAGMALLSSRSQPPMATVGDDPLRVLATSVTGSSAPAGLSWISNNSIGGSICSLPPPQSATAAATAAAAQAETIVPDLDYHTIPADQEYVLVDGDLVAIPVAPYDDDEDDHTHDDEGEQGGAAGAADRHADQFLERQDRSSCKASRMQRGVRKFKTWKKGIKKRFGFKKHHREQQEMHDTTAASTTTDSLDNNSGVAAAGGATTDEDVSTHFSLAHSSQQAVSAESDDGSTVATNTAPSVSEMSNMSSPSRGRNKHSMQQKKPPPRKKKNRLGWLRDTDRSIQSSSSSSLMQPSTSVASGLTVDSASASASVRPDVISLQSHSGMYEADGLQMDDASSVVSSSAASFAPSMIPPPLLSRAAMPTLTETSGDISTPAASLTLDAAMASATAAAAAASSSSPYASLAAAAAGAGASTDPPLLPDPHSFHRSTSIAAEASFVGNVDSLFMEAGVVPADAGVMMPAELTYIEDRLDDYDKYDKKDDALLYYDPYLKSMVRPTADFKVDKQDAPCVDSMLRMADQYTQALEDSAQDSEPPLISPLKMVKGKSDGESVPLSMASSKDPMVHNDILKLVMVGAPDSRVALARSLRQSTKKSRKRTTLAVDVHSWMPPNNDNVKFTIWDVQGVNNNVPNDPSPNFGAHPGTQSLFFSDRSLYLLVWDMAANNYKTYRNFNRVVRDREDDDDDDEDYDEEEEHQNEYQQEEANRQADRALQTDIEDRVLSWVDCVARRGPHSAVLPIALIPPDMSLEEARRRCDVMQSLLMVHTERNFPADLVPPKVLSGAETVMCVSLNSGMGMDLLQEMILDIATDASHSVFDHVLTAVPPGTVQVMETVRRLKDSHKLVMVDHLMAELPYGVEMTAQAVMECLSFLCTIGEVLYFNEEMLCHYVILSRKWLVSALSCILRNDLKRELAETRRFMNMQCLYSDQRFPESHVTEALSSNASNCPVISSQDTQMLWQSMSFMREAADRSSQLSENSTTTENMFGFLERLLVHTGVFLPLDIDKFATTENVYFVPSLLSQSSAKDVWTYKSSEAYLTTLCHSFLFRDGTPVGLMEHVIVALLRDLYEFSHVVAAKPLPVNQHNMPARSSSFPLGQASFNDFMGAHDGDPIGHIKIHQIVCWKNSALIKIGRVFGGATEGLRESFVEIFVAITDRNHPHSVATDAMRSNMQRLVVSAKGQVGSHGHKIWKGGFDVVLDSIKANVANSPNVDRQVVCPECLAHNHPSSASTWSWDSVRAATDPIIRCMRGHKVDRNMICGTVPAVPKVEDGSKPSSGNTKPVKELLPSVVVVGLWDSVTKVIRNVGSGFVVDKKLGLIVTAGHIVFNMEEGRHFGAPYQGLKYGRAVIGVIPEGATDNSAVFRYFAEIIAEDVHNMDACVLKITTKLESDVDSDTMVGDQPEKVLEDFQKESLPSLKMTKRFELEETVRILGFNQGGEGILEQGKHVNRSADFAKGYICKQFRKADDDDASSSSEDSSGGAGLTPREELVVMCPTISGHSGGPCVNDEGRVVGILSRADPVDRQRCYLVPSSELKMLVNKAKKPGGLKMY